jgi:iron complex transport system substrate-binding protein
VRASLHSGSSLYHLDSELLERLAPDLIITQELCKVCTVSYEIVDRAAKRLTSDPRVVSLEPSSLDDVLANIAFVGELTGHTSGARALLEALSLRIEALRAAEAKRRPRTLVLEWTDPPMGPGHWTPGLVELAGGTAILSNPGANSQRLEWETIAQADPDAIIVAPCGFDVARAHAALAELATIPEWTSLRAHREKRVHVVDGNAYVNRPGPRLVDTAEIFARLL